MRIELNNLCYTYNKKDYVLNKINYCFESNNCYILKGANGSGKTTLSKLICGLLKTKEGVIEIDSNNIYKQKVGAIAQKIGYLYQNPDMHFFAETVKDELEFPYIINGNYNEQISNKIESVLEKFDLLHLKESFPLLLSGGEKQRLALATVFIRDIEFIVLDEPSSSIDIQGKKFVASLINSFVQNGFGALIITHDEEFESMLHNPKTLFLKDGRI